MPKKVLTIAGSDSLSGGGLQADLATFNEYGLFGLSIITSIVTVIDDAVDIHVVPLNVLSQQLSSVLALSDIAAIKIGFVPNIEAIELIAQRLKHVTIPIILDPVMVFKETNRTEMQGLLRAIREQLVPLATVVTPNLIEAELLADQSIETLDDMKHAAQQIKSVAEQTIVIKGGNRLAGHDAVDVVLDEDNRHFILSQDKIKQSLLCNNGAGCTFAASITANYAIGANAQEAITNAKEFVYHAIKQGITLNQTLPVGTVWPGANRYCHDSRTNR